MTTPLQLFGQISLSEDSIYDAMLCADSDKPDELMIHLWDSTGKGLGSFSAVLVEIQRIDGVAKSATPKYLYKVNTNGGIWLPPLLTDSETKERDSLHIQIESDKFGFDGKWTLNQRSGKFSFDRKAGIDCLKPEKLKSWDEFKIWASKKRTELDFGAFRGQGCSKFRLQTSFHRAGRSRLERYAQGPLLDFQNHAEAVTGDRIDVANAVDYATLLGLAQHHGLPTPMLDLTYSPYIAAFFAFSDALENKEFRKDSTHVRIYAFTNDYMNQLSPPSVSLAYLSPYISFLSVSGRNNPRLYMQQGKFLVTNIAELESFIHEQELKINKTVLHAVDIPIECIAEALDDLRYMGITAATLFPGLDGVGRMLRHSMLM
jgi:hypothetical protein